MSSCGGSLCFFHKAPVVLFAMIWSLNLDRPPIACPMHPPRPFSHVNMPFDLESLQFLFGQAFGDPSHRTRCTWTACSNSVPKVTRNHATLLLKVQQRGELDTIERIIFTATKYMLCNECTRGRRRIVKSAQALLDRLLTYASRIEDTTLCKSTQYWPTSMCQVASFWADGRFTTTLTRKQPVPYDRPT